MIDECNFVSKVKHDGKSGCNLTSPGITCPGEENCIIFQIYKAIVGK